jgi:organic hydroperoxide reductase OsmC/OhrA
VARERQAPLKESSVTARVGIGRDERNRFKLQVALEISAPGRDRAEIEDIARVAHEEICPYSHATRGNIDLVVNVSNVTGQPQSAGHA